MEPETLSLFPHKESENDERKESWVVEECLKALAALANTRGGTLWVGIKDNGDVAGWFGGAKEQEAIANQIVDKLAVHPASVSVMKQDGKPVLVIRMNEAAAPISIRGRYYRRVGNTSRELPAEELARFLLERTGQTWDALPVDSGIESLSTKTIEDFKALSRERLPQLAPSDTIETILAKLKLVVPHKKSLKKAAILLFGEDPQQFMPAAQIQIGRFRDEETILDDKRIEGNLFQQISQAEQILRTYVLIRYEFPSGGEGRVGVEALQRREVWEFPYKAVREALINALIHRDYTSTGRVQIRVYDDRMVISNPGGLPVGLTVHDLLREPHDSLPRNPILAQICYYAKLVEQWGSGTIRMRNACRAQRLPDPTFVSTETGFSVTLRKDEVTDERLERMGMNSRQIQVIHYVRQNGSISNTEHQAVTGAIRRTASRDLEELENAGILVRSPRSGRTVRFVLAQSNPSNGASGTSGT